MQRTRHLTERLHQASVRLTAAQQERVWAIVSAHQQGLSIRQIALATRLSAARVHQLLTDTAATDIPVWLSRLRERDWLGAESGTTDPPGASLAAILTEEVTALRQCLGWLEQAERGETVVVNLRPDTDPDPAYVVFERWRIRRVVERIAADLDDLVRPPGVPAPLTPPDEDASTRYRRRLAEPPPRPRRRSVRDERAALRAERGLPPLLEALTPSVNRVCATAAH